MPFLPLHIANRLWWGDVQVGKLWWGDDLIADFDTAPNALAAEGWELTHEMTGPTSARGVISIPDLDPSAVEWQQAGGAWQPTVFDGGTRWLLADPAAPTAPRSFSEGAQADIRVRYIFEFAPDWSPASLDAKGFTVTEATITPTEASVTINLTAGVVRSYDVVAEGVFAASGGWSMTFRVTSGTDEIPHTWEGSVVTFYPEHDETSGDRVVVVTAFFPGDDPVVEFGTPPANTVAPVLSGVAVVGATGSVTTGTWSGSNLSFYYRWRVNGDLVPGATSPTRVFGANESTVAEVRAVSRISTGVYAFGPWAASNLLGTAPGLWNPDNTINPDGIIYAGEIIPAA